MLMAAVPLLPGMGTGGRRSSVDQAAQPWAALARVQVPGGPRCTGVFLDATTVLTAAHCVFLPRTRKFAPPGSVHVLSGYARGEFGFHTTLAALRTHANWDPNWPEDSFGADAAVLTLATASPAPVLPLAARSPGRGVVALGGYNQDRAEVIEADLACHILEIAEDERGRRLLRHDCAATRGTSGAPLLIRQGDGWAIAGLQVGAAAGQGGVAVPVETLRNLLTPLPRKP
jgi:protease YdgD